MTTAIGAQLAIQRTLNEALAAAQLRNRSFSLRAFARKLALSPSALSEILNGKRRVSRKMAERILTNLCLPPQESKAMLALFPLRANGQSPPSEPQTPYFQLSTDQYHLISEWYHFAILSLCETDEFSDDPKWIATRLNIRPQEAQSALDRLLRMGMLRKGLEGKVARTGIGYSTSDDMADVGLKKAHATNLDLARRSLDLDAVHDRDFTAMTLAIDPGRLPVAKKMIREFQDKLANYLECQPKREVYKICIQLIPLSRKDAVHAH